jgi:hypothetical protein
MAAPMTTAMQVTKATYFLVLFALWRLADRAGDLVGGGVMQTPL